MERAIPIKRTFNLSYAVTDAAAFVKTAAERLVEQNAYGTVEDALAELGGNVDVAARVLLDPGELPGAEILDSGSSVDEPAAR